MSEPVRAYAATRARAELAPIEFVPGPLRPDQVEVAVEYCGICHSDLSMLDNEWRRTKYPFVPGHEIVGRIVALGSAVPARELGQRVGIGWYAGSCMHCSQCLSGAQHLCAATESTIVGRHGGFAERVRAHWAWALPLPEALAAASSGPLFCGGITVFAPIVNHVGPLDRVGVIGIGGLGHLALKFLRAWGCEVTAFTSNDAKHAEALQLGAHHAVSSRDSAALKKLAGHFDFLLVTANVALDWPAYLGALAPRGRLHFVGAVLDPIPVSAFSLIGDERQISGSPLGSPATAARMLDFCARHAIAPQVELYPMSQANAALEHLRAGRARYRIVLQNDF